MSPHAVVRSLAFVVCAATPAAFAADVHWEYGEGHGGPAHWAELSPRFAACTAGKHQSPIDIIEAEKAPLPPIRFTYQPGTPKVINNGHTIQVILPPGNSIAVGGHEYELVQFHFHAPSEEAVSGKRAPLVAHFVHEDAEGNLAVVAVLFDVSAGNTALTPVFANMPVRPGAEVALDDVQLDPAAALPANLAYYEFEGSLTTPPCSEGVRWLVLQQPSTVSQAQLSAFRELYPDNARPLQPLNGRHVRSSM